jgi:hypothetical protein
VLQSAAADSVARCAVAWLSYHSRNLPSCPLVRMIVTSQPDLSACWICGRKDDLSREHFPKKADTRNYFAKTPLYRTDASTRNERVQGPGSDRLTLGAPICATCNSDRTSPFDKAWDQARAHLLLNWPTIVAASEFNLEDVFASNTQNRSVDLQLYFVKILGCVLVEQGVAIDLNGFIQSLMQRRAHPLLRLLFADASALHTKSDHLVYVSDLRVTKDERGVVQAVQLGYVLRPLSVQMNYVTQESSLRGIPQMWHPLTGRSIVQLGPAIG